MQAPIRRTSALLGRVPRRSGGCTAAQPTYTPEWMEPYHYTKSGIDNVWLTNGVHFVTHPDYGEFYHIDDVEGLHRRLADDLIDLPRPLNGAEFRFLRREFNLSQHDPAALIGSNGPSVAKWEKECAKPVTNRLADRLLRLLVSEQLHQPVVRELLQRLSELDFAEREAALRLEHVDGEWRPAT